MPRLLWPPPTPYEFETSDLLLNGASLPSGWQMEDIFSDSGPSDDDWAEERAAAQYIRYDEGRNTITRATIQVWRYRSQNPRDYEFVFSRLQRLDPPPSYITFTSRYADKWEIHCVIPDSSIYACIYSAAYDEFLVEVWVKIARGDTPEDLLISPEEINALFAAQDQRMADFLDLEPQE